MTVTTIMKTQEENIKLLRRSNWIHDRLSALWFDISLMVRDPKTYSLEQLEKAFSEIEDLTQERIEIWHKRAINSGFK